MSKISIRLLTDIHIGNGETLIRGNDYFVGKDAEGDYIGVINPKRVLDLIGERNIGAWLAGIDQQRPTDQIVRQFKPNADTAEYSSRIIECLCDRPGGSIKAFIHDGLGHPYIPGSSIKGAIRSATLAHMTSQKTQYELRRIPVRDIERQVFGLDPTEDKFRFLQVGDALFGEGYGEYATGALTLASINERVQRGYWDTSTQQTVEVLQKGDSSTFELRLKPCLQPNVRLLPCMESISALFNAINSHTINLLQTEIEHWEPHAHIDHIGVVNDYIEDCERILAEARRCNGVTECVLRLGAGSGWRFITGAWAERLNDFRQRIVPQARPKNQNYGQYDFPKTRRVASASHGLLGFVKLTLKGRLTQTKT